jgi:hypothetical protein
VKRKVYVFGLDGATWKIITPMLKNGKLPHLARLCETGSFGNLESISPIFSPIIWTSISSGKSPLKHGITAAQLNSKMVRCKRVWDILENYGYTIGLCGHLVTWPPRKINGYIIPDDLFSHGIETYPEELNFIRILADGVKNKKLTLGNYVEFLIKCLRFGIKSGSLFKAFAFMTYSKVQMYNYLERYYRLRFIKELFRNDLFIALKKRYKPDYSFYYNNLVDNCCHLYWKFMEPEKFVKVPVEEVKKYNGIISAAYSKADKFLGRVLEDIEDDAIIVVVSDHGFRAAEVTEEGWDYVIKTENLLKRLHITSRVSGYNLGSVTILKMKDKYKGGEADIVKMLKDITVGGEGSRLFDVSVDEFSNIHAAVRKKFKSMNGLTINLSGTTCVFEDIIEENDAKISGLHDLQGIFILNGKGILKGKKIYGATVLDITPTLLALLDMPVARDMDGKVIEEAISPDYLKDHPIKYIDTYEDGRKEEERFEDSELSEEVKERLKALGYYG